MKQKVRLFVCWVLVFMNIMPVLFAVNENQTALQHVTLQLKWTHQFEFAGYYAAIERGFYSELGLHVDLMLPDGELSPVDKVTKGEADFGITSSDILLARAKNKKVVVLSSIFQHSPNVLLVSAASGITHAQQLAGKTIAMESDSAEIIAFLEQAGVFPENQNVKLLRYDATQLLNGETDAISSYITDEPYLLDSLGFKYNVLVPMSGGIDFYGDVLFTSEKLIAENPELVAKFRNASLQGWKYAMDHPFEIIDLIHSKYGQHHSKDHLIFEMEKMKDLIWEDFVEIGYSNPDRWQKILKVYQKMGLIDPKFTIDGLLYDKDYQDQPFVFPWKLFGIFLLILSVISTLAYIFYTNSRKLRREINSRQKIQKELSEREAHYRSVLMASPDTIVIADLDGQIRFVSQMVTKMLGYNQTDILNRSVFDYIDKKDHARAYDNMQQMFHQNFIGATEYIGHRSDGSNVDIEVNGEFIRDANQQPVSIVFVIRDITARKTAETKILKANRFYSFISHINECIIQIRDKNKLFQEICRITIEHGKFRMCWIGIIDEETKIVAPVAIEGFENGYFSKIKQISVSDMPEGRGPTGTAIRLGKHHVCNDIANDPNTTLWKDYALERDYHSSIALPIKQKGKVIGAFSIYSSVPHFFDHEEVVLLDEVASNISFAIDGIETENEKSNLTANLELMVSKRTTQLADSNENLLKEIEERKRAEIEMSNAKIEAEQANVAKSEFLSRMSHELRTPMNSILGFAQLMQMGELNTSQKKGVSHILRSGKHLLDLINEVLDITRIESGRLSLSLEPIQLSEIIHEMIETIRPLAHDHQVTVELLNSHVDQLFVKSDRQRLKQVLLNLIHNAIKYNRKHGSVMIKTEQMQKINGDIETIRISIQDTGTGISPENISKLFNPFERIGADQTGVEGSGLGLVVVKKLVDAMACKMGVESIPGEGSTFWIELPQVESQLESIQKSGVLTGVNSRLTHKTGTILYIEDNISNIELVEQILNSQRSNIDLITKMHGKQAVHLAIDHKPDLILLDLDLPDIHGSEVLKLLQAEERTKTIPVVIISADAMTKQIEKLMRLGAKNYLTKPIEVIDFLRVIDDFIKG